MSKKTATQTSPEDVARMTEWCQVRDGVIHAAIWSPDGGGFLTSYTTTTTRKGEETTCMAQSWTSLDELTAVFKWDDRANFAKQSKGKLKVCKHCEAE